MKKIIFLLFLLPLFGTAQDMTNEKLQEIYTSVSDSIDGRLGGWKFFIKEVPMMCLTDTTHNRMRIISPIAQADSLSDDLIKDALVANFHTALDVKYAISEGVLWSVFIHPLKELSEHQVKDAVSQVYYANINFGTTFTSTSLTFPGSLRSKTKEEKNEKALPTELKKL
ncbi:hypothetical protein MHTCC0001_12730 [Flavobacteriaceae bacterium MHTCC 0001]